MLARCGDEEAKLALFERFRWFLLKYRALLKAGVFNAWYGEIGRDVRAFLSLYAKTPQVRGILLSRKGIPSVPRVVNAVNRIIDDLYHECRALGDEDVDSIIDMSFFQCLERYDPNDKAKKAAANAGYDYDKLTHEQRTEWETRFPEIGFEGFLYNYFYFILQKNLNSVLRGVQAGLGYCQGFVDDIVESDAQLDAKEYDDIDTLMEAAVNLDYAWVNGDKTSWPWNELSQQERWLIVQRFHHRRFACDIAAAVGMSASVVRNRINRVREMMADWRPTAYNPILKMGDEGTYVRKLQRKLSIPVTGEFDFGTHAAVVQWQRLYNATVEQRAQIKENGEVDPRMWDLLDAAPKQQKQERPIEERPVRTRQLTDEERARYGLKTQSERT